MSDFVTRRTGRGDFLQSGFRVPFNITKEGDTFVARRTDQSEIARADDETNVIREARKVLWDETRMGPSCPAPEI